MVLEDDAADALDGAVDRRELHEHLAAVAPVLDHVLDGFEVADEPRHAVEHRLRLRVAVLMAVRAMCMVEHRAIGQHMDMFRMSILSMMSIVLISIVLVHSLQYHLPGILVAKDYCLYSCFTSVFPSFPQ